MIKDLLYINKFPYYSIAYDNLTLLLARLPHFTIFNSG